jgi:glucuronoarabinoxylan endo-1,4-beta-xylanase
MKFIYKNKIYFGISIFFVISFVVVNFLISKNISAQQSSITEYYYSDMGDGDARGWTGGSWDLTRNASVSPSADYISTTITVGSGSSGNDHNIIRGFLPIDTSAIPDNASITSAVLKLYPTFIQDNDNDGNDFLVVVGPTSQSSASQITTDDFDQCGSVNNPQELSSRIDYNNFVAGQYNDIVLNNSGIAAINKTGITFLGLREGHDVLNDPVDDTNWFIFSSSNEAGTSQDPYLEVTYTIPSTPPPSTPPTCISFTYSSWSSCQPNGTQTRTVISSSPSGCTGGNPVTTQNCTYVPSSGIIFEDDFSDDAGWTGGTTIGWGLNPPSKWTAYKNPPGSSLSIESGKGQYGTPAAKIGWQIASQAQASSLAKHLTGNKNTGYDELYIRYQVKFDDNWKSGSDGTDTQTWKWWRLWQYRSPTDTYEWSENNGARDTRFIISNLNLNPPVWHVAASPNVNGNSNIQPYVKLWWSYSPGAGNGSFEQVSDWEIERPPSSNAGLFKNYALGKPQGWHTIEWHIKLSTIDQPGNGIFEMWVDGVKQKKFDGVQNNYGASGWTELPTKKYMGGINFLTVFDNMQVWSKYWDQPPGTPGTRYLYLDNVVVSSSYIGPNYIVGATSPSPTYACSDGIDNDNDGFIDMADPGCDSSTDNDEYNITSPVGTKVNIDGSIEYQRIDGFGGVPGAINSIRSMSSTYQKQLLDLLYDSNVGIGLSIVRIPISYKFEVSPGNYDITVEDGKAWIMNEAKKRGVTQFFATPWSPPAWMKTNNDINNGGSVKTSSYSDFANYLAQYIIDFKSVYGIDLYAVSLQNEPDLTISYPSCRWTGSQFHDFIKNYLIPTWNSRKLSTKIILAEEMKWKDDLIQDTLNDPATESFLDIIASHGYWTTTPFKLNSAKLFNKTVWQTEESGNYGTGAPGDTSIDDGIFWANRIHDWLTIGEINGWVWYWLTTDKSWGKNWGAKIIEIDGNTYTSARRLWTIGQFSKFIRPGFYRVDSTLQPKTGVKTSAYKHPSTGKFVIVAINSNNNSETLNFTLKDISLNSVTPYITTDTLDISQSTDITVNNNTFTASLPAKSVTTFVGNYLTQTQCTSFTYSPWSSCQPNGTQTRTVISSSPSGCTGGNPVTTQSCTYIPPDTTSPTISNISVSVTENSATITWDTNEPSDSQVEYGLTVNYQTATNLSQNLTTSHSVTITGLSDNTTYNFRVRSADSSSNISVSINRTFTTLPAFSPDITPPSAITDLSAANITQTSADLSWTAPGDDGNQGVATGYDIRYSTIPLTAANWNSAQQVTGEPTPAASGLEQYVSVGLQPGTTYYFAIKTLDEAGNVSDISNVISLTTLGSKTPPATKTPPPSASPGGGGSTSPGSGQKGSTSTDSTPPAQPNNFRVQGADKQITLTWSNPQDADFVRVKILRTQSRSEGEPVCPTSHDDSDAEVVYEGNSEEYMDINLSNDVFYCYAIFAYDRKPNYSELLAIIANPKKGKETLEKIATGQNTVDCGQYADVSSLFGSMSAETNKISFCEAQSVYGRSQFVSLDQTSVEIYEKLKKQTKLTGLNTLHRYSIAYFIHVGTPTTKRLGSGERAGVINSYYQAFNKLPQTQEEWSDVIKIANGRWPTERSQTGEETAKTKIFKKIYLRDPDMANPYDNAAVTVITYGLRPANRNLDSERAGITIFKSIYGYNPSSAQDWDIVRAIAYSGATR